MNYNIDYQPNINIGLLGHVSNGKCMGKNTRILLYNGGYKFIEDITKKDTLLGFNNEPRKIINTTHGKDFLYKIFDTNTYYVYRVNKHHILTLYSKKK